MINKNLLVIASVPVNQIICILWFCINFWKTRILFLVKLTFSIKCIGTKISSFKVLDLFAIMFIISN